MLKQPKLEPISFGSAPIALSPNPDWLNEETRPSCKYAPVVVDKKQTIGAISAMRLVLHRRIKVAQLLAADGPGRETTSWFSFLRAGRSHEPHLRHYSLPILVLSGGSAAKLGQELCSNYNLAWHPANVRGEPVYLIVHKLEHRKYCKALAFILACYRNMHIIGWDGGKLTGFGAARAAALAFADSLPYRPRRIIMMDQDVVQSTKVRIFNYGVGSAVERAHCKRNVPVIGLGVGLPTRALPSKLRETLKSRLHGAPLDPQPDEEDYNSPAQQAVSILAPFRKHGKSLPFADGVYPSYMVSGGEDMLMGLQLNLPKGRPGPLIEGWIVKKALVGPNDLSNEHWTVLRVRMLKVLYDQEKKTQVLWYGKLQSIETLLGILMSSGNLSPKPAEVYSTSSCIIERIILRLCKLDHFPKDIDQRVFATSVVQRQLVL